MTDPTPPGPVPPRFSNLELRALLAGEQGTLTALESRLIEALIFCQQRHGEP